MTPAHPSPPITTPADPPAERGERVVPYHCPFCAEQDLRPHPRSPGAWHCRGCLRIFTVRFLDLAPLDLTLPPDPVVADPPGAS